jgi:membrane associated rhomboid family serine protease
MLLVLPVYADTPLVRTRATPWVTWTLVALNLIGFSLQVAFRERVTNGFSLVPAEVVQNCDIIGPQQVRLPVYHPGTRRNPGQFSEELVTIRHHPGPRPVCLTLLTSQFLHGGVLHLVGNLMFLVVFGSSLERLVGNGLYFAGYLLCGVAAGIAHVVGHPTSILPCLGASGAVSGLLGAFLLRYPFSRVYFWFWFVVWFGWFRVPAFLGLGVWLLLQCLGVYAQLSGHSVVGVAYLAHLGGFAAGMLFLFGLHLYREAEVRETVPRLAGDSFLPHPSRQHARVEEHWR